MRSRVGPNKENQHFKPTRVSPPHTRSRGFGRDITNITILQRTSDPRTLPDYAAEIYEGLYQGEMRYLPAAGYMKRQSDITDKMRGILLDWLVEVHLKFKLSPETLFLTTNILDRVLEREQVVRGKLQLIGVVALLIAAKYEEIFAPEVRDLVHITDNAFSKEEILGTEAVVLRLLEYNITTPSAYVFLGRFAKVAGVNPHTETLAWYLLELALVEYKMLKYRASLVAAAALFLASKIDQKSQPWSLELTADTHYSEAELKSCAKDLCILAQGAEKSSLQAVRRKFMLPKYLEVSRVSVFQAITPSFKS